MREKQRANDGGASRSWQVEVRSVLSGALSASCVVGLWRMKRSRNSAKLEIGSERGYCLCPAGLGLGTREYAWQY